MCPVHFFWSPYWGIRHEIYAWVTPYLEPKEYVIHGVRSEDSLIA